MCAPGFLRYGVHAGGATQAGFNPPSSAAQAAEFIEGFTAAPSWEFVQTGAESLQRLLATARETDSRGNLMSDARIAAACWEHGILTNVSDFARFVALHVQRQR